MKFKSVRIFIDHDVDVWSGDRPSAENLEFVFDDSDLVQLARYAGNPRSTYSKCRDGAYVISPRDYSEFIYCLQNTIINPEKGDFDVYQLEETYDRAGIADGLEITEITENAYMGLIDYAAEALLDVKVKEEDIEEERESFRDICLKVFRKSLENSKEDQA